jgi:hypothetical protein
MATGLQYPGYYRLVRGAGDFLILDLIFSSSYHPDELIERESGKLRVAVAVLSLG